MRLLFLAPELVEPEESLPQLAGMRPAPEPIPFREVSGDLVERRNPDAVIVDGRDNPDDAASIIRKIRNEASAPALVVLSPSDAASFDGSCGVGDFITSESRPDELKVRLDFLVEPAVSEGQDVIRRGNVSINRERFEVKAGDSILGLTFKEFELLEYLAHRPGKVCSRNVLLRDVWGYDFFGGTRTVDVHVRRLRAKLGTEAHLIETVRNVGYRFSG
jgi:DNA-binding response OmpR family regulator